MSAALGLVRPEALPLFAAVALLGMLVVLVEARRDRALLAFAGRGAGLASVGAGRRRAKLALALLAGLAVVVALAGPYVAVVERPVVRTGVDLVVALDVSQSMAVRDVEPDRLRAAKEFIGRLGDSLTQSRVSLVLFSGEGVVRYPTTADPAVLGRSLESAGAAFRPAKGGSSLSAGLAAALEAFPEDARKSSRSKAIVVVSDGEETVGVLPDLDTLRERNVRVFAVGVGTVSGGAIPVYGDTGAFSGYLHHSDGSQIVSRSPEQPLRSVAERTRGRYWRLAPGPGSVNEVATELKRLDSTELGEASGGTTPDDRYQPFLLLAIALLLAAEAIPERRPMPHPRGLRPLERARRSRWIPAFVRAPWSSVLLAITVLGSCAPLSGSDADRMYLAGDVDGALRTYRALLQERPGVAELHVNTGNALYQLRRLDEALDEYAIGIRDGNAQVRAIAEYQRGNTLFRLGKLDEAREAYKAALRIDPGDRDAKFNIEIIDRAVRRPDENASGPPQPGASPAAPGSSPAPGEAGQAPPAGPPTPGQDPGQPGAEGPQASGPPSALSDTGGSALSDALLDFRRQLTLEEALRFLDALLDQQRGIEEVLEGPAPAQRPQTDPTY